MGGNLCLDGPLLAGAPKAIRREEHQISSFRGLALSLKFRNGVAEDLIKAKKGPIIMKLNQSLLVILGIPVAAGLFGAAAYLGLFLYGMMQSSMGRGGGGYVLELPKVRPLQVKESSFCSQKSAKWIGCF